MGNGRSAARQAGNTDAVEKGARLGYGANGLINLIIGWIALQLAWGGSGGGQEASASGALRTLAEQPVGAVLLWVVLVGFVLLAAWYATEAVRKQETKDKVKAAVKTVVYLFLAGLTGSVVLGSGGGGGGGSSPSGITATLMQQPFGRILVAAAGLGIIGVGVYHVVKGWKKRFLQDLQGNPGTWAVRAGRAGYIARGVAFGVVGGLVVTAAATADADQAQGLDGALQTLRQAPYGQALLTLVALGFIAYGFYCFARARYARV